MFLSSSILLFQGGPLLRTVGHLCPPGAWLAERDEKEARESAAAEQRRAEWQQRELTMAKERSMRRAEEIREWRSRQRGEYLKDPRYDNEQAVRTPAAQRSV